MTDASCQTDGLDPGGQIEAEFTRLVHKRNARQMQMRDIMPLMKLIMLEERISQILLDHALASRAIARPSV